MLVYVPLVGTFIDTEKAKVKFNKKEKLHAQKNKLLNDQKSYLNCIPI